MYKKIVKCYANVRGHYWSYCLLLVKKMSSNIIMVVLPKDYRVGLQVCLPPRLEAPF